MIIRFDRTTVKPKQASTQPKLAGNAGLPAPLTANAERQVVMETGVRVRGSIKPNTHRRRRRDSTRQLRRVDVGGVYWA